MGNMVEPELGFEKLRELVEIVRSTGVAEIEYQKGDFRLYVLRNVKDPSSLKMSAGEPVTSRMTRYQDLKKLEVRSLSEALSTPISELLRVMAGGDQLLIIVGETMRSLPLPYIFDRRKVPSEWLHQVQQHTLADYLRLSDNRMLTIPESTPLEVAAHKMRVHQVEGAFITKSSRSDGEILGFIPRSDDLISPEYESRLQEAKEKTLYKLIEIIKTIKSEYKKIELILYIFCLVALIYSYPMTADTAKDGSIEIPALSMKLPLLEAIAAFPTIIAVVYLVFGSLATDLRIQMNNIELVLYEGVEAAKRPKRPMLNRYFFLPSSLHTQYIEHKIEGPPEPQHRLIEIFIGALFSVFPYLTVVYLTGKAFVVLPIWVVAWNIICLIVMLFGLVRNGFKV